MLEFHSEIDRSSDNYPSSVCWFFAFLIKLSCWRDFLSAFFCSTTFGHTWNSHHTVDIHVYCSIIAYHIMVLFELEFTTWLNVAEWRVWNLNRQVARKFKLTLVTTLTTLTRLVLRSLQRQKDRCCLEALPWVEPSVESIDQASASDLVK